MWGWQYVVVWCGTTVDACGEKGALLPARPERRHPNFARHQPSESLDLRRVLRAQTAHKSCQVPSCKRHASDGRWCEWHGRSRRRSP